ncbi:unnamed protein product, partial [Brachionus calyciflorus]
QNKTSCISSNTDENLGASLNKANLILSKSTPKSEINQKSRLSLNEVTPSTSNKSNSSINFEPLLPSSIRSSRQISQVLDQSNFEDDNVRKLRERDQLVGNLKSEKEILELENEKLRLELETFRVVVDKEEKRKLVNLAINILRFLGDDEDKNEVLK